ncbi:DNA gyrase C-terminal beta-propeller domain-containing protein, partial [Streptococcus suis]
KYGSLGGLSTVSGYVSIMVISDSGVIIRTSGANISQTGRSTLGVKVMRLNGEAKIMTFALVDAAEIKEETGYIVMSN